MRGILAAPIVAALLAGGAAFAQPYPAKPVRLVIPFSAGGPIDTVVRPIAARLTELLGQSFVLDYHAGANGIIATDLVAKAAPDGHTLLVCSAAYTTNPSLYAKLPFDTLRDFVPVSLLVNNDMILVTNPSVPAKTVRELIALVKGRPGRLAYGSSGNGGSLHLAGELFKTLAGVDMVHVPYKGAGPALFEVIGGHVDLMFIAAPPAIPHVRSGKVRLIASAGLRRAVSLPEAPTVHESGVPGYEVASRYGVVAPAATPKDAIAKLNGALAQVLGAREMRERLAAVGSDAQHTTPEEFGRILRDEVAKWADVIRRAKVPLQN